jgi:uncharacterized membrane protein YjjP (DUF1212 family)
VETKEILTLAADAGQIILESGGETYRVEETCNAICLSHGMARSDCFALPTGIMLTAVDTEGAPHTVVRRISKRSTDIEKVTLINRFVREGRFLLSPAQSSPFLEEISTLKKHPLPLLLACSGLIASLFAYLFGGTLIDAAVAFPVGVAIQSAVLVLEKIRFNQFFNHVMGGLIAGLLAYLAAGFVPDLHTDQIIIGSIMLLVPGILIVNAMRDIIAGDLVAGITRALEAFMISVAIAAGTGIALVIRQLVTGGTG